MDSFSSVIETLGGTVAVSRAINMPAGTVRQWRFRDNIPPSRWPQIVSLARAKGDATITYDALAELARKKQAA